MLDIKITADTSDDLLKQIIKILADYALVKFMFLGRNIDYLEVVNKLKDYLTINKFGGIDNGQSNTQFRKT